MSETRKTAIVVFILILISVGQARAQELCPALFAIKTNNTSKTSKPFVEPDLNKIRLSEIAGLFGFQIRGLNRKTLKEIEAEIPKGRSSTRAAEVSLTTIQTVLESARDHEVVGIDSVPTYSHEGESGGYCFGRAMYIHLKLLALGVDKSAIKKAWVVGPIKSTVAEKPWKYHVATIAYVSGYGWMAIDANTFKVIPLRTWANSLLGDSLDGKARLYVTDASRFSISTPQYTREMMGLDMLRENDYFKGYFFDLMRGLRAPKF